MLLRRKEPIKFSRWHAVVLGIIIVACIALRFWPHPDKEVSLTLARQHLTVLLADTYAKQYQGLSDRDTIKPYDGMLFVFGAPEPRTFVMRRMRFALDMIWIQGNTIVDMAANLPLEPTHTEGGLVHYTGREPADKVLELPAGFIDRYDVKIGDKITFGN